MNGHANEETASVWSGAASRPAPRPAGEVRWPTTFCMPALLCFKVQYCCLLTQTTFGVRAFVSNSKNSLSCFPFPHDEFCYIKSALCKQKTVLSRCHFLCFPVNDDHYDAVA